MSPVSPPSQKRKKASLQTLIFSVVALALVAGGTFYAGYLVGRDGSVAPSEQGQSGSVTNTDKPLPKHLSKDVRFDLFWDVWNRTKNDYITKDTPDTQLFYGALRGIVSSLEDPYSEFFDPDMAEKFDQSLSGTFDGIGAEIGMKNRQLVIVAPLPSSPAERAGVRAGDRILLIDKRSTVDMSIDEAVSLIRGKRGSEVTLTLYHEGDKKERAVAITRDKIVIPSVVSEMKGDVAYIKVSHFNQDTGEAFRKAVRTLTAKKPRGLVLDLRNDPGGYLDTAVEMAGYWIGSRTAVIEKYGDGRQEEYTARGSAILSDMPTVVLVNEGSASASEIVAGALQDYKLATIVGMQTFGKGSVQNLQRLPDGSAIKLTIAKWLTPNGRSIDDEGIKPDIEIDMTEKDYEEQKDPQLEKALEIIRQ